MSANTLGKTKDSSTVAHLLPRWTLPTVTGFRITCTNLQRHCRMATEWERSPRVTHWLTADCKVRVWRHSSRAVHSLASSLPMLSAKLPATSSRRRCDATPFVSH